ncbi:MAG TPA: RNA-binding S4 domain-containing protein [Solimonas sp.]
MQTATFTLEAEYIEVNQLLKLVGVCDSGGAGKLLVAEGHVTVDGQPEHRKTAKIRAGQIVVCDGLQIAVVADTVGEGLG